ncbi:metalloregulator ArsR/SmtB family transcription factor [Nocardiopsis sp. NRRL B-16309]|uniref:helix-turn-helix domain-containing GNAT family N-acetyltransferase n=1 Tax=Nocardiopsis sp. NRRL B-16309 TaxID=1519494 RepID=UPI0006B005B1|nr:metalloregulator ArsR/SmtB family transcription factor [Nocardiopsis sp. NRRL B-16309]KOX14071.1 ArsR family transcriptional regulator [Nocardiopsis sp. NRRL B-16309]
MTVTHEHSAELLPTEDAETYAAWFACLAEPTRVRLLHAIATYPGAVSVGQLAEAVGVRQPTVSHHLRKLAEVGFVTTSRVGTSTRVAVNAACCTGLPHAADAVMGMLAARPCCPTEVPEDVTVRALTDADLPAVRHLHAAGAEAGDILGEGADLDTGWLDGHAWAAERDGTVVGWAAAWPVSRLSAYAGVAETRVHVARGERGRGVGKALARTLVVEADLAGLWTLQASVLPEDKAALSLLHASGYRTLAVRERLVRHRGEWRDVVVLERRRDDTVAPEAAGVQDLPDPVPRPDSVTADS